MLSRLQALLLVVTALLTSRLDDDEQAQKWKVWVAILGIFVPVAPYEIWAIFPINDRVNEWQQALQSGKGVDEDEIKAELGELLDKWQTRNLGRAAWPLATGVIALLSVTNTI